MSVTNEFFRGSALFRHHSKRKVCVIHKHMANMPSYSNIPSLHSLVSLKVRHSVSIR